MNLACIPEQLDSLTVFAGLRKDPVIHALYRAAKKPSVKTCSRFVSKLYEAGTDEFSAYLRDLVYSADTCVVRLLCQNRPVPDVMMQAMNRELLFLEDLCTLKPSDFPDFEGIVLPDFRSRPLILTEPYLEHLQEIDRHGYGDFALYHVFRLEEDHGEISLRPVAYPDPVTFRDLIGYERQRAEIIENTEILLAGYQAANALLYGDAGTGKSATVKAVTNEFRTQGLRLIELSKSQLHLLPQLLDILAANPLKFILFIDDLSFQDNDDDFSALKAVLEGSASVRSSNTVIYATSNRRHIVRESFQQREGDDVHRNDTMQETISLSERFGLKVYFEKPKKDLYQQIVSSLADQYGLEMPATELSLAAEQFALRKAGRSARAARQLVEQLSAKQKKKESEC